MNQPQFQPRPQPIRTAPKPPRKGPILALILSLLLCGLGQIYTGNIFSAIFWFLTALVTGFVFAPLLFLVIPVAALHAAFCASGYNARYRR